jgi:MFS family permease
VFELTFGVIGYMFGRKRLLAGGALLMMIGELIAAVVTPSPSTHNAVLVVWIGMALAGVGGAALFPTSLAMIAAKTRTARARGPMIPMYAAGLSSGCFLARTPHSQEPRVPEVGMPIERLSNRRRGQA